MDQILVYHLVRWHEHEYGSGACNSLEAGGLRSRLLTKGLFIGPMRRIFELLDRLARKVSCMEETSTSRSWGLISSTLVAKRHCLLNDFHFQKTFLGKEMKKDKMIKRRKSEKNRVKILSPKNEDEDLREGKNCRDQFY